MSRVVTPGSCASPSPWSVAPHDGQVASVDAGSGAEHHGQRDTVRVASSAMAALYATREGRRSPESQGFGPHVRPLARSRTRAANAVSFAVA